MFNSGPQGFFGGLGGGQGSAPRAGKYDQFGRPIGPRSMNSDLGGATNMSRSDEQAMALRGGRYDQFGRPLASGTADSGPKLALLPAPGVVYPKSLRVLQSGPAGMARVTSAPVGPSKEAMIEHACRPIMKVDKTSSHYPWADKEEKETSPLMPPPLMPGFDPRQPRSGQSDRNPRNRPAMRLDRPGLGFGEDYERGDPDKRRDGASRPNDYSRARSPDRRSSDRKGRVDVRFEGRGLRDLYQDNDFGKSKDKSDDRRSDTRDTGRRRDDRGRSSERRDRGRDRDTRDKGRDQKSSSRSRDDGARSGGSWNDSKDGDRRDSSEETRRKERLEQQRNRQAQRSNSLQDMGQADDFDTAWQKASAIATREQDLFGSTPSSTSPAWWTSCTICKTNFRYKEEFTAHVDEPLHYINLEKVRKEYAKEKAVKKVANVTQTANAVESIIYHCKICNISLNGWANFNQHVSSQIHLVHFIKNVGNKGDPKGLEYFEVSDRNAPAADGRNQNHPASLLTDWRRCKSCNMEIPSWEDPHVSCPNKGKINEMGFKDDRMADNAPGDPSDESRERSGVLPEELHEKKKALGPAIFLFIRESLTRSNFPGLTREVPLMVPSEVSVLAAELISGAQKYPTVEPGNVIVGAVVNGVKLYITRKKKKGWKCWTRDVCQVQDRLRELVTFCGGQTTDLEDKFKALLELAEREEVSVDDGSEPESTQAERSVDMFVDEDKYWGETDSPALLIELKNNLTKLLNGHIQSTFSKIPCRVPPKVPKAVFTAAENLNAQDLKSGHKSGNAVIAAVINSLKLKETFRKTIRGKLTTKNVYDMFDSLQTLVSKFSGDKIDFKTGTCFSRLLDLAHDAPNADDMAIRKIVQEALKPKKPIAQYPHDNLASLNAQEAANAVVPLMSLPLYQKEETREELEASYADVKKQLTNAVFIYVTDTLNSSGGQVPTAVSERVQIAAERLNDVAIKLDTPSGFSVTSAVESAMTDTIWQGVQGKISPVSVRAMNWSLGALVTKFGGKAESLTPRFEKLVEMAMAKNKEIDELDDTGGSTQYQDLKLTLKKLVLEHVRDTLITGVPSESSSRVPLEIISAAKDLDTVAIKSGLPQGQCVTSAVQKALLEASKKGAYVLGRFSEASLQKLKQNLESLVAIFGGNADGLTNRFNKLLEMREEMVAVNSGISSEYQVQGLSCPQEDKLLFPDLKKHLTHRVLKHLRCILNNMSYTPLIPTMLPTECFEAATNLSDVALKLNLERGDDVTSAVSNALCEAIRRGFSGNFTPKGIGELKVSVDDFLMEYGGNLEALNPNFELLFKYAEEMSFSAGSAENKMSKGAPRFDELKLMLKKLVLRHVRDVLNGAPRKVMLASTLPPEIVSAAEELATYAEQYGLNAGETVREIIFRAMKELVKNHYGSGLQNLRGKFTVETVDQLKGCIEGLVTRFGGDVYAITTKFDTLYKYINVDPDATDDNMTSQDPQGLGMEYPPGTDIPQNTGMRNPKAFHEDLPLAHDSTPQQQLRGPEFAEVQKTLKKMLIANFRDMVAGGDDYCTSDETKLEIFTAAKELDSYDISCAGAPGAAVAVAIQHAARATSFKRASMKCIQDIKDSMVGLVDTLGGTFPARLAERFNSQITVARIREAERAPDSREVVDMDIETSDEESTSDTRADASASKAEDSTETKNPDVLPNKVFQKKMAVRVAIFQYLKDCLYGRDNPKKSSMVPENVYTAVTELFSSAVENDVNPGTVVTGAVVAAVEFVIKRMADHSWKFNLADVTDAKGRLDILVGSFGGDPAGVAPVFDMVMTFAKESVKETTGPTQDPSETAIEKKNEPTSSKSVRRSRKKKIKEGEKEEMHTEPDETFEGTQVLPVFVVKRKADFGIGVDKFCKQLLISKDYSKGIPLQEPFAVSDPLKSLLVELVDSAKKRTQGCDIGDVITSAMVAGVNTFCDGRNENWHFNSSAAVYDLKGRMKNLLISHGGYPAKLDEVFSKLMDFTKEKGPDISEIEDLTYDEIVELEGWLGLGEPEGAARPSVPGQDPYSGQNIGFNLLGQGPDLPSSGSPLDAKMPVADRFKMEIFTYLRNKLLNRQHRAIPDRKAEELASSCQKFGADVGLTITSGILQGIQLVTERVKEGPGWKISQSRTQLKSHFARITELVAKYNGNGYKVRLQLRSLLDEIDGSAKTKWYIRKVERLQKIAVQPAFQKLKDKATERYKLHLRTQQHFDNTVSDVLREVIQEETNFIKKQAANGKEKNVEDIERNRKAFWETQMPLNHIRPSQGQMDDAYSTFLKEAGIDDDNRQGDSNNSQSSPHFREQRGGLPQQKSDQGRQQSGRRQDNRGPDGGGVHDYGHHQQTTSQGSLGGSNRFDQVLEAGGRPSSSSTVGGLSSQGQSVLSLFDKFLVQTGGGKRSNPQLQGQGQGQDHQASKLLDTIQQKLENIGDVEDDSAINMILDRVLNEYKALKTGGSQPISQAQPSVSIASAMAGGPLIQQQMPGSMMQLPGMQMQQQLLDMQMQQQLHGMQGMQTPMVRPLFMPTQGSLLPPPAVSMMQSNMQQQMMQSQPGLNQQGQLNLNQQGQGNRNQGPQNRNQQGQGNQANRNQQGQLNRNQQGQGNRNQGQQNQNQQGQGNQANRNQQGQLNRNQEQPSRDEPGPGEQPNKMRVILAASLAATLAGKEKKEGLSETTKNKLSEVLRSLNERLEPGQRKRPSRWGAEESSSKIQQDRHVSPERKRPRDRSPDQGRGGPNQGDKRPTRFNEKPEGKRDMPEPGRNNQGKGPPINLVRKDEWMNEMKMMHEKQMGGPNRGGGPRTPGAGGPRGPGPIKSLLPPPGGPGMNRPGPGGPGIMENAGPNIPVDRITALYGDIMNVLAPGSVNTPQEMSVATEMIASLSQAMACVLNNIYNPESQVKIQQSAQKFKLAFGNHPLVQAFFAATSVPPDVIRLLAKLDPMLLKRVVIVLQQARMDIQQQALQSAVFLEKFMVTSNLRM